MAVYQHFLAAVDFGKHSATVLQRASSLAEICDARLTVLHVVDYMMSPDLDYLIPPPDETEDRLIEAAHKQLRGLLEREALSSGVGTIVVSGRPKIEIVRAAEHEKADLIVVGGQGGHGIAGLLGSTADRVLHRAGCDVLTVR